MPGHKYEVKSPEYVSRKSQIFIFEYVENCSKCEQISSFPF